MLLEVKVALNFIVSYLYNKLPRRRADLFGEELERLLVARFEGHWYPEAPLRGSAFRCLHLGAPRDPVVELAARRSGLDTEEVRANVPAELSVWVDPYEVSYQIGETGALKVLYLEDPPPPGPGGGGGGVEPPRGAEAPGGDGGGGGGGGGPHDEARSLVGFNPEAQVFVPVAGGASPSLSASPPPPPPPLGPAPPPGPALFSYPSPPTHSSNASTPSPPLGGPLSYLPPLPPPQQQQQQQPPPGPPGRGPLQPITFTTASFAATKFGSTKMKKSSAVGPGGPGGGGGGAGGPGVGVGVGAGAGAPQRILSRSPPAGLAPAELLKHKPLALALHALGAPAAAAAALGGPAPPSQLSPNAKEFVFPGSPGPLYFEVDPPQPALGSPFQPPHHHHLAAHPGYDPFARPAAPGAGGAAAAGGLLGAGGGGGLSYGEKPPFGEGLGGYALPYPSQSFQPVVLAN